MLFTLASFVFTFGVGAHAAPTKLRVAIEDADNRPYEYRENSRWVGYHIEIIEAVAKRLQWDIEWLPIVWIKVYNALYTNKVDAVSFLMRTPARSEPKVLFLPDNILTHFEISVYTRVDSPVKINLMRDSVSALARYQVGAFPGGVTERWLHTAHPEILLDKTAKDAIQLFHLLENHRVDFVIGSEYIFNVAATANPRIKTTLKRLLPNLAEAPAYIAFQNNEKGRRMGKEFSTAFRAFRETTEYKKLKTKYNIHQ